MPDWTIGVVKLAMNAYKASQPCDVCFGTVIGQSPLTIEVEALKLPLSEKQLIVPDYLTDRVIQVEVDGKTGTGLIPGALKAGDRVILAMKTGGQKYVVIGKEM